MVVYDLSQAGAAVFQADGVQRNVDDMAVKDLFAFQFGFGMRHGTALLLLQFLQQAQTEIDILQGIPLGTHQAGIF